MERLLIISEPLDKGVQDKIISTVCSGLSRDFEIFIYAPYVDESVADEFRSRGVNIVGGQKRSFFLNSILGFAGRKSESSLWFESWLREAFLRLNSLKLKQLVRDIAPAKILNMSMTVNYPSDVFWIQGPPLSVTLKGLDLTLGSVFRLFFRVFGKFFALLDNTLIDRMMKGSVTHITNSKYLMNTYTARGYSVSDYVYSPYDFAEIFYPSAPSPTRDYVLAYVGKEVEISVIRDLARHGIKIKAFGSKVPVGINVSNWNNGIEFLGKVTNSELRDLYSNALFTVFPFTVEPFGLVPAESMACGTPVLTYNDQGPSETVLHGKTGWLVNRGKLHDEAVHLWNTREIKIEARECVVRAAEFSWLVTMEKLNKHISPAIIPVIGHN